MADIVFVHSNPTLVRDGKLVVDRKFHLGMLEYVEHLKRPLAAINPVLPDGHRIMDAIEIPLSEVPYQVLSVRQDEERRMATCISKARLVYGNGLQSAEMAHLLGVAYIQILEYDLETQLRIIAAETSGKLRCAAKMVRRVRDYWLKDVPNMWAAHSLHCNGYPIFDATRQFNSQRLLYFDSRTRAENVITEKALEERLTGLGSQPLRLIYSGRYERMKGADDSVRVAVECLRRGLNIELDCYGQGSLREEMERLARPYSRIRINDAVPYPRLVRLSQNADVFLCCHIQSDPSCSYLEAMGAGLPIVGYGNRMWSRLAQESKAGVAVKLGSIAQMASALEGLSGSSLFTFSRNARSFALEHSFEREFAKRINAIKVAICDL